MKFQSIGKNRNVGEDGKIYTDKQVSLMTPKEVKPVAKKEIKKAHKKGRKKK